MLPMFLTAFHRLMSDKPEPSWIEPWTAANFCKLRILLNAVPSDLCCKYLPEPVPPKPLSLVRDVDAALVQQVLDTVQRERIMDIHHHPQADDVGRRPEAAEDAAGVHPGKAIGSRPRHKPIFSDIAVFGIARWSIL
ncbi:MAG: hypothetical protein ACOVN4_03315 [Bosea sp. (in: a-proteobacteria)]